MPERFANGGAPLPPINPAEQHVACVLLVDTSGSMSGNSIREVNDGIRIFAETVMNDSLAKGVVDVCVIEFNDTAQIVHPFAPISQFEAPTLSAGGCTAMNEAILIALDEIRRRKDLYVANGIPYYRPWMFLLTDGLPTDDEKSGETKRILREKMDNKSVIFFPVAVEGADVVNLASYPCTRTLKINGSEFQGAFEWLSNSVISTSKSDPCAAKLDLPPLPGEIISIEP